MAKLSAAQSSWVSRTTGGLNCCALLFLVLACFIPLFVVATLDGDYDLLNKHYSVDLRIGQGLFQRDVCYGQDRPKEDVLKKFGLSCKGRQQTNGCDKDKLSKAMKNHCKDFRYMQGNEITAIIFCIAAVVFATRSISSIGDSDALRMLDRFGAALATFIALCCASAVIGRLHESDVVKFDDKEAKWDCQTILGADLCHGYGTAYYLQSFAIVALVFAFIGNLLIAVAAPFEKAGNNGSTGHSLLGGS